MGYHSTKKAISIDEYDELREQHHDLIRLQVEEPTTLEVYTPTAICEDYLNMGKDIFLEHDNEKIILNFYIATFDLWERVWELKEEEKKKFKIKYLKMEPSVGEYEWTCWLIYLEKLSHHWLFRHAFDQSKPVFDKDFMKNIRRKLSMCKRKECLPEIS